MQRNGLKVEPCRARSPAPKIWASPSSAPAASARCARGLRRRTRRCNFIAVSDPIRRNARQARARQSARNSTPATTTRSSRGPRSTRSSSPPAKASTRADPAGDRARQARARREADRAHARATPTASSRRSKKARRQRARRLQPPLQGPLPDRQGADHPGPHGQLIGGAARVFNSRSQALAMLKRNPAGDAGGRRAHVLRRPHELAARRQAHRSKCYARGQMGVLKDAGHDVTDVS